MRKFLLLLTLSIVCVLINAQTITNSGAKINIKSGTTVKFTNLHNSGSGGSFYYDTDLAVPGNWTNVSPATFTQGSNGSVTLNGSSQQTITSAGSSFKDLTINNSMANNSEVLLGDNMEIESELTLNQGIINTNSNTLVFQSTATSNSGNADSFVHGKMKKVGATQFTFPSGDVISRDLDGDSSNEDYVIWSPMKSNPSASTTVNIEYFFNDTGMPDWWQHGGNMDATLHHVSNREYWLVSSTEDFTNVTLFWNDNDHTAGNICEHSFCDETPSNFDPSDLVVTYWNGSMWKDADYNSGSSSLIHDQGYITSRFAIPFGAKSQTFITYGSKDDINPLPVELTEFTFNCHNYNIELLWTTASETNNKGFIIEKALDGSNFKEIGFVDGEGNSNQIINYEFDDINSSNTGAYYRLKQIDNDGNFSYSNFIYAYCENFENEPSIEIYPNPFKKDVNIIARNLPEEKITLHIYDMLGSLIYQKSPNTTDGNFDLNIDLEKLPPAMYVVKVISGEYVGVIKIEKR